MPAFHINIDLSHLVPQGSALNRTVFPALALTVRALLDRAETVWKAFAAGAPLPSGKSIGIRSGQYHRSIMQRETGDFSGEVYSLLPYAVVIERGAPARDLKTMLNSSLRVRVSSRTGRRYLIIPFRHDTGKAMSGGNPMPQAVADWWQGRLASAVTGHFSRPSGTGAFDISTRRPLMVPAWRYRWGERLVARDLQSLGVSAQQQRRMAGMVLFRSPGKQGGAAHTQFLTFRTMSENSRAGSWVQPAREGLWPARTTADQIRPLAEGLFRRAVEDDVRRSLPGSE